MAKQSRDRSSSGSRANAAAADGGGENRWRSRNRSQSNENKRAPPTQPPRKLRAAYKAGNCKEGTKCSASHDVGAWLEWRDYNFAARGRRDS
eukprot:3867767-Alexandrium_andersonii.AAC.1